MDAKPWYQSRTIWANVIGGAAAIAKALGLDLGLDTEAQATLVVGIMAVVNLVLRLVTTKPVR